MAEMKTPDIEQALFKAGFARRKTDHFDLALESIRRLMSRLQWY